MARGHNPCHAIVMHSTPTISPAQLANEPIEQARKIYSASGLAVSTTYAHPFRRHTTPELTALDAAIASAPAGSDDAIDLRREKASGWHADPTGKQLRLDVTRANLVCLRVPGTVFLGPQDGGAAWAAIQPAVAAAPVIKSHDGLTYTAVFSAPPGAPVPEFHMLELLVSEQRIAPVTEPDPNGGVRLPHAGVLERWAALPAGGIPVLPAELAPLTLSSAVASADLIREWLDKHYEKIGMLSSAKPTTRHEVYEIWLAANSILPSQVSEHAFGHACQGAKCFSSKRTKHGWAWQIARNDVPLGAMAGVPQTALNAVDLAEFKQWKHLQEMTPQRKAARAEAAAAAKQRAEADEYIRASYGSQVVFDMLRDEGYLRYHGAAEGRRYKAAGAFGEAFVGLELMRGGARELPPGPTLYAEPSWWTLSPPGTPPEQRYRTLVETIIQKKGTSQP